MKAKKYILGFAAMLAIVGMSSCKGDYDDWADPQHNDQEDAITVPGFTASAAGAIDLNQEQEVRDSAHICTLNLSALPENYKVTNVRVQLTPTDPSAKSTLTKSLDLSDNCMADSATLQGLVSDFYGLKPTLRPFTAKVLASAKVGDDYVYIDAGTIDLQIAPKAPTLSTTGYYLVGNVKDQGWTSDNTKYAYRFNGADPYDNPVITFKVPADGLLYSDHLQFKLLDLDHVGDWNAATVLSGKNGVDQTAPADGQTTEQVYDNQNGQGSNLVFEPTSDMYYVITVNLLDQTVVATTQNQSQLFMTGGNYGWGTTWLELTQVNGNENLFWKVIYLHANEEFKFSPKAAWDGDFSPTVAGGTEAANFSTPNNVSCSKSGWYLITVDKNAKTINIDQPEVYLKGDVSADGWGGPTDADKFSVPTSENGLFVSPVMKAGSVRVYVNVPTGGGNGDWWRNEFGYNGANIVFRANGNDPGNDGAWIDAYPTATAGQVLSINFSNNTVSVR